MLKVGLTGGIGSGKSAVAARLAARGAVVIDADKLAREAIAPGSSGLAELLEQFGSGVLAPDGSVDRAAVGRMVFGDETARRRLEKIVHPRVRAASARLSAEAAPDAVVVEDVPLLAENGLAPTYHLVIVVQADERIRLDRLVRLRGMTEQEAYARLRAQASDAQRAAVADALIRNEGSLSELDRAVGTLWTDRLVPYEANVRHRRAVWPAERPVVPYDPAWPQQYARLAARIAHATGPAALAVSHTGLTAVPGQAAPDVLDIEVRVPDLATAEAIADLLAGAGFPPAPEQPVRERLHGYADPGRPANVYVRPVS